MGDTLDVVGAYSWLGKVYLKFIIEAIEGYPPRYRVKNEDEKVMLEYATFDDVIRFYQRLGV